MTRFFQKFVDQQHAGTIACLSLALIFSPVVLLLTRPFGQMSVLLAAIFSASCVALAWAAWVKNSRRRQLSVVTQPTR